MNSSLVILVSSILVSLSGLCMAQYGGYGGLGILPGYASASGYGQRISHGVANVHFPGQYAGLGGGYPLSGLSGYGQGGGGSRAGQGYIGNPGIGIRQTGANLANLYGLPQSLAQAPAPRALGSVPPLVPPQLPPQQLPGSPFGSPYGPASVRGGFGLGLGQPGLGYGGASQGAAYGVTPYGTALGLQNGADLGGGYTPVNGGGGYLG